MRYNGLYNSVQDFLNWVFMCGVYVCCENNKFFKGGTENKKKIIDYIMMNTTDELYI